METRAAEELRRARDSGAPRFVTTPTKVEETGHIIPPIHHDLQTGRWRLESDWFHTTPRWRIDVPRGWETDLADVPGALKPGINAFEFGVTGPLLHDFIYEHEGKLPEGTCRPPHVFTREEADALFRDLMWREGISRWRRWFAWVTVRLLGAKHWRYRAREFDRRIASR